MMPSGDHASSNNWNNMQQGGAMTTAVGDPGGGGGYGQPGADPMSPNGQYGQTQPDGGPAQAFPYPGGGPPGGPGDEKPAEKGRCNIQVCRII